jgi:hypothetical protein
MARVPLGDLQRRIQAVIDRKGRIEILQLSGGEPTLHPQFFEVVDGRDGKLANFQVKYVRRFRCSNISSSSDGRLQASR